MTREMIDHIARQIVGLLQWLTDDEEWLVMERAAELQRDKRRSEQWKVKS